MNYLELIGRIVTILGIGGIVSAGFLWFARAAIDAWIKNQFNQQLEDKKASLQSTSELLKYQIQKQMIHAELRTKRAYEVYPKLYEKLHDANGMAILILRTKDQGAEWRRFQEEYIFVRNYRIMNRWILSSAVDNAARDCIETISDAMTKNLSVQDYRAKMDPKMEVLTNLVGSELMPQEELMAEA